MIAVIDYGMGNLHSVSKAVERLGYEVTVTADEQVIRSASALILPGVGAFGDAMKNLRQTGLDTVVQAAAERKQPLLGICLGMQLLFDQSEEHGRHEGLGLLPGKVVRFQGNGCYKVPHMGWNRIRFTQQDPILDGIETGYVYFVHSYHVLPDRQEHLLAVTNYDQDVTAIVGDKTVYGMQFHPEKSGEVGMSLLANFLRQSQDVPAVSHL